MTKLNFSRTALTFISKKGIVTVNGVTYAYSAKHHCNVPADSLLGLMLREDYPYLPGNLLDEILKTVQRYLASGDFECRITNYYVAFNNCVVDAWTGNRYDFDEINCHDVFAYVPHDFNVSVDSKLVRHFLDTIASDEDTKHLLLEIIGYAMLPKQVLRKFFILKGKPSSGKSTFLKVLKEVLGEGNYAAVGLDDFDDKFAMASMCSKRLNIMDDLPQQNIKPAVIAKLKSIISNSPVYSRQLYQEGKSLTPIITIIGACNVFPNFLDTTGALANRLVPVDFSNTFTHGSNLDPELDQKIVMDKEAMTYLVSMSIMLMPQLLSSQKFTMPSSSEELLKDFDRSNNTELVYLETLSKNYFEGASSLEEYQKYVQFCESMNLTAVRAHLFKEAVMSRFDMDTKRRTIADGSRPTVFVSNK